VWFEVAGSFDHRNRNGEGFKTPKVVKEVEFHRFHES